MWAVFGSLAQDFGQMQFTVLTEMPPQFPQCTNTSKDEMKQLKYTNENCKHYILETLGFSGLFRCITIVAGLSPNFPAALGQLKARKSSCNIALCCTLLLSHD